MTENIRQFEKDLRGSEELRKKLSVELAKIAKEKSVESDAEAMVKAAQTLGYDFTVADMEKIYAETQELDPEEMEQAAGGWIEGTWCFADYDRYAAWNHDTPGQEGTACFSDYGCFTVPNNSEAVRMLCNSTVEPAKGLWDLLRICSGNPDNTRKERTV